MFVAAVVAMLALPGVVSVEKSAVSARVVPISPARKVTVKGPPAAPVTVTLPLPTVDSATSALWTADAAAL